MGYNISALKLVKQITTNKLFLLVVLIGLFLLLSNFSGEGFFEEKNNNENKNIRKEEIVEDTNDNVGIENEVVVEEVSPTTTNPSVTPAPNNNTIDAFVYPGGSVSGKSNNNFTMESTDSAESITNWYKAKIEEFDMNATSVVTTNTNGNVLNKIAASNGNLSVEIEISSSNGDNSTKIKGKIL